MKFLRIVFDPKIVGISDGQWDSVFGLGFGRLQGSSSADVVDTFQSIGDDRVWIVAFGTKIAHFIGFGREIGVVSFFLNPLLNPVYP